MTNFSSLNKFEPKVLQLRSHSVDHVNHLLRHSHWQPKLIQLEQGLLDTQYLVVQVGGIQFSRVTVNLGMMHCSGSPDRTITFGIPLELDPHYTWCGHALHFQQILVYHANQDANLSGKTSKDLAVISIDVDDFISCGLPEDKALFDRIFAQKTQVLSTNQMSFLRVKNYLLNLFDMAQSHPENTTHPTMQAIIRDDFLPLFLECLSTSETIPESISTKRYQLVKQAESHMLSYIDRPLTLRDLCTALDTKSRTLQMAFLEVYGISPMTYLKVQRLHGARQALKTANPKAVTILGVATQWGFWHMGYFSQDYKKLFGETPSQTLKDRSEEVEEWGTFGLTHYG
jgi:AraC family ethanolamine operon transcriptional activator